MFENAVEAGLVAAAGWAPEDPDPAGGGGCCPLCFRRYRMLVLEGPLRALPHAVAHAVVRAVDERIEARVNARPPVPHGDHEAMRRAAATGGLLVVALEELGAAEVRLSELRTCFTEPAVARYLERHRVDDAPWIGS